MRMALGVLGWSPSTFWNSTPHEFIAAYEGKHGEFGQTSRKRKEFKKLYDQVTEAQDNGNTN